MERKEVTGRCRITGKEKTITINCIDASSTEGAGYAKAGVICDINNAQHTCQRDNCPIWIDFCP